MSENITIYTGSELVWILNAVFQHECIMCHENPCVMKTNQPMKTSVNHILKLHSLED
jgi:hypothetical protein